MKTERSSTVRVVLMIFTTLAVPAIFTTLVTPVIQSLERHFVNGKKIHAGRRQGDRREDFKGASDLKPKEFSRSSEEHCAVDAW